MYALVVNGVVSQIEDETFPVCDAFKWVECGSEVKTGYVYDDGNFSPPVPD